MVNLPLGPGVDDAGRGEPNRLFLFIAIGLVGMLVLGLLGIAGYVLFSRTRRVAQMPTETPIEAGGVEERTPTPTSTLTMTPTPRPTNTPTRAPTFTPVVIPTVGTPVVAKKSPPATRVAGAETPGATTVAMATTPTFTPVAVAKEHTTPQTGLGLSGVVGIGLVLGALAVAARRLRSTG